MSEVATYQENAIRVALVAWLQDAIQQPAVSFPLLVHDSVAPDEREDGFCILAQIPGVRTVVAPMALGSMLLARYQVTTVAKSRQLVGVIADRVRTAFAAPDDDGEQLPLVLPGVVSPCREAMEDGVFDIVSGLPQWTETFEVYLVPDGS